MGAGDPDMPCVQQARPCWTTAELATIDGILSGGVTLTSLRCGHTGFVGEEGGGVNEDDPPYEQNYAWLFVGATSLTCVYRESV